jgi:hypothetical protein
MGSLIERYIYDGGDGSHSRYKTLGYCVESPYEVLYNTVFDYIIHSYKQSYCYVINKHPIDGLVIREAKDNRPYGFKIIGSLDDILKMDDAQQLKRCKFDEKILIERIKELDKYTEHFDDDNMYKEKYRDIVKDLKQLYCDFQENRFG